MAPKMFIAAPVVILAVVVVLAGIVTALTTRTGRTILSVVVGLAVAVLLGMFLVILPYRLSQERATEKAATVDLEAAAQDAEAAAHRERAKGRPLRRAISKAKAALHTEPEAKASTEEALPAEDPAGDAPPESSADDARPAWVDAPPRVVDGVYRVAVTAGPYKTRHECEQQLGERLQQAIQDYAEERHGPEAAGRMCLPLEEFRSQIVKEEWEEAIESRTPSVGTMIQLHVLLGFDRQANTRIDEALNRVVVGQRIWWCGTGLGAVLLLLSVVYAYLKTSLATAGAYRWRLRLAAAVMILGVAAAAVLAAVS